MIDSQPKSGYLCILQQVFEMPTKIIFAQFCSFVDMPHHLPNLFLTHILGEVFHDALELR